MNRRVAAAWLLACGLLPAAAVAQEALQTGRLLPPRLLELSQAAIGRELPEVAFVDSHGRARRLSEFRGRPLLVSLVFTACVHSCSVTTRHLDRVVQVARDTLGRDSFTVLTVGFDRAADTPEALRAYAARHGVRDPDWHFLGIADDAGLQALVEALGFYYVPSPRGFDHTVQVSVIDATGVLYRQVYGETFEPPLLVEPLKDLVWGRPSREEGFLAGLGRRVRLLCTVYDARAGRYHFDYSLIVGLLIGLLVLGATGLWLALEMRGRRPRAVR